MSIRPVSAILHAAALGIMVNGFNQLSTLAVDSSIRAEKGGHFQFLTIQGLVLASLTMLAALLSDVFPSAPMLRTIKRSFLVVALPLSVVVSTVYWTLLTLFAPLILRSGPVPQEPSSSSEAPQLVRIPLTMDLALHAVPAIAVLSDFLLTEHKYAGQAASIGAPLVSLLYGAWYSVWIEYCASYNKRFPYPFLDVEFPARLTIYACATVFALGSFRLLNHFHS